MAAELRRDPKLRPSIMEDVEIAGVERWEPWGLVRRCRLTHAQWQVRSELMRRLKAAFETRGIQSP